MNLAVKREFKDALFEQFARIGKALSSGRRLELIELLAQGARTVEDLAGEASMSIANCSQHLQVLRAAHLVEVRREGLFARYRLADERVFGLWLSLRELAEARLAEIDRVVESFLKDRRRLAAITSDELAKRLKHHAVVVLDVRPEQEYREGHIAGARSIPLAELERRIKELPRSKQIVAYCRGPYCVFAEQAVSVLSARGFKATRLRDGLPEWRARGRPVERAIQA